tara:strand:- start:168 stop:572 length:405 start_codon:yes stop_codon:yes gene_type:complete
MKVKPSLIHRVIVSSYVVLSLAAVGRSSFQVLTKFEQAPLAYTLSSVAAAVYLLATVSIVLARGSKDRSSKARKVAFAALTFELGGVLIIGSVSLFLPDLFPDQTVWSHFGIGYVFVPLFLPLLGLWWLSRNKS